MHLARIVHTVKPGDVGFLVTAVGGYSMELSLKPDLSSALERIEAYWHHEDMGRPCIAVRAPQPNARPVPAPASLEQKWLDVDYRVRSALVSTANTYWGGEAIPMVMPNLGPDVFTGFLGAELEFHETTSWAVPFVHDWRDAPDLAFDPSNKWYGKMLELTRALAEAGEGKFLVGITDIHSGGDALAAMSGQETLALGLIDAPQNVRRAMDQVLAAWYPIYDGLFEACRGPELGSTSWLVAHSKGKFSALQCDFSCLISEPMFQEFLLPEIAAEAAHLDNSLYHLDGPLAIRHVEALCSIPQLDGIQWTPGAGQKPMREWAPLLRRIQELGKCVYVGAPYEEVIPLVERLDPSMLFIVTHARTPEDADALLRAAEDRAAVAL